MRLRMITTALFSIVPVSLFAFPCFLTMVKDSCWTNYDVSVVVTDVVTNKSIMTIAVPAGKSWDRQEFVCQPGERLMYTATFSPIFWATDQGKSYLARNYWLLPSTIGTGDTAWNINVCYPADFEEVPMPPNVTGNCACNFKGIPAVPLQ